MKAQLSKKARVNKAVQQLIANGYNKDESGIPMYSNADGNIVVLKVTKEYINFVESENNSIDQALRLHRSHWLISNYKTDKQFFVPSKSKALKIAALQTLK